MTLQIDLGSTTITASIHTAEILRGSRSIIDRIAAEWRDLCDEGPHNEPFYRPEWISAYLQAFEPRATVVLVTVRHDGRLRAVLPLIEERIGLLGVGATRLRGPVNEHSNRIDLIHGMGDGDLSIAAAWRAIAAMPGWDVVDMRDVPDGGAFQRMLAQATHGGLATSMRETLRSPYIPLHPDGTSNRYTPPDASFRRNLRRGMRKLAAQGPVKIVRRENVDAADLQRFFAAERSGWKGRNGTAIACRPDTQQFYRDVAHAAADHGYFALYELWCGDDPVAYELGFALGGRYFVPKVAFNEAYRTTGPGHLMIGEVVRDLEDRSMAELDMLGHTDAYKARWTGLYRQHYHCHIFGKGPVGRAIQTWTDHVLPAGRHVHRKLLSREMGGRGISLSALTMMSGGACTWCL